MEEQELHCPNCSAPLKLPLGETEAYCDYCGSQLRFLPDANEMQVVRTREEMKYKERVAVQRAILQKQLEQEEAERWRRTAAQVAIAALPVVGSAVGRGLFRAALGRRGGCLGCGCGTLSLTAGLTSLLILVMALR
jgi:DNA-directed RNA polymerase subunit RPC12/RpoP